MTSVKLQYKDSINVQNTVALLYTNSEQLEEEIKKTIPFTTASKRIPRMNLTKRMID